MPKYDMCLPTYFFGRGVRDSEAVLCILRSAARHLAAHEAVDGLVVMATPLHLRDRRLLLLRPFHRVIPYWRISAPLSDETLRDASHGYDRMPTGCLVSMLDFFQLVIRELAQVRAPTLLVYSPLDPVAPPAEMRFIHERLGAAVK